MSPNPLLLSKLVVSAVPSAFLSILTEVLTSTGPEFAETSYKFPPTAVNPAGFLNDAIATCPKAVLFEFARTAVITPSFPIVNDLTFCQLSSVGGVAVASPGTKTESGILSG